MPAPWEDVRRAYREALMGSHPDTSGQADGGQTSAVVEAFRLLRRASVDGTRSLVDVVAAAAAAEVAVAEAARSNNDSSTSDAVPALRLDVDGGQRIPVLDRVAAAMALEGQVSGLDRSAGLVQSVVTIEGFSPSQLTAEVVVGEGSGDADDDTQVLFTLEPLGAGTAPPLASIVDRMAARVGDLSVVEGD